MTKRVPEIRFEGFTDDWEQCKVRELFTVTRGQVLAATKTKDKETDEFIYPVYSSQTKNNGLMGFYNQYLFENAITWTTDGANAGTVNFRKGKFYSTNVNGVLLSDKGYANKAISEIINKIAWKHVSKVGNPKLMNNIMSEITIMIPSIEELNKISILFNQIDNTIALHQRKLEQLQSMKDGFLQKMFPIDGEKEPEIRFPGFTDDWEQRKFEDGTSKIGDGLHGTPEYTENGEVAFINGNNLVNGKIVINDQTKFVTSGQQSRADAELNENTMLMSINGTIGNLAWYRGEKLMLGKSAAYIEVKSFHKKFIYQLLQTHKIRNYFLNNLTGTTIKNLGLKTIRETPILIPKLDEQQKIGSFFERLDDTIALHQRELELLKQTKKAFLQKMFV